MIIFYNKINKVSDKYEKFCEPYEHSHALLAPNIPYDRDQKYKIGGKYCQIIDNDEIVSRKGKYIFPIPKFLYDGIWDNNIEIKGDVETKKWFLTNGNIYENQYATNNFFHVPEAILE